MAVALLGEARIVGRGLQRARDGPDAVVPADLADHAAADDPLRELLLDRVRDELLRRDAEHHQVARGRHLRQGQPLDERGQNDGLVRLQLPALGETEHVQKRQRGELQLRGEVHGATSYYD